MSKDFNVYKWRRDHLFENEKEGEKTITPEELFTKFKKEIKGGFLKDKYIETEYRGSTTEEGKVEALFSDNGYNLDKVEEVEGEPGERLAMVKYYFKKK